MPYAVAEDPYGVFDCAVGFGSHEWSCSHDKHRTNARTRPHDRTAAARALVPRTAVGRDFDTLLGLRLVHQPEEVLLVEIKDGRELVPDVAPSALFLNTPRAETNPEHMREQRRGNGCQVFHLAFHGLSAAVMRSADGYACYVSRVETGSREIRALTRTRRAKEQSIPRDAVIRQTKE